MTAFVVAMEAEAAALEANLEGCVSTLACGRRTFRGRLHGRDVGAVVTGVGKVNAAAGAQLALTLFGADELVNFGLAGGFADDLAAGDVCEIERAVEYDFDLTEVNGTAVGVHEERRSAYFTLPVRGAGKARTLATGDRFVNGDADLRLLRGLGAEVRDMEGAAVAHVAEAAHVPCRAFKCIANVFGRGPMTAQYAANREACLGKLREAIAKGELT